MSTTRKNTAVLTNVLGAGAIAALATTVGCNQGGPVAGTPARTAVSASAPTFGTTRSFTLIEARTSAAVASLGSGALVLVAGGRTALSDATDTAELVDAGEAISTPLGERLATPRAGARAVTLAGERVLVLGGHDAHGQSLATTEVFDRLGAAFTPGPTLTAPRDGATIAFVSSAQIAILGGAGQTSVEVLDLVALHTTRLPGSLARSHEGAQARVVDGQIVLAGGADAPEVYDLATGIASTPERTNGDRTGEAPVPISGGVLLVGGASTNGLADNKAHQLVSPFTSVESFGEIGTARVLGQTVAFGGNEVIVGGRDASGALLRTTDVVAIPSFGTEAGPELSDGRVDSALVAFENGQVVVIGGDDSTGQPLANIDLLLPPGAVAPDAAGAFDAAQRDAAAHAQLEGNLMSETVEIYSATVALKSETAARNADDQKIAAVTSQLALSNSTVAADGVEIQQDKAQLAQTQAQLAQSQQALSQANAATAQAQNQVSALQSQVAGLNQTVSVDSSTLALDNQTIAQLQAQLAAAKTQPTTPSQPTTSQPTTTTTVPTRTTLTYTPVTIERSPVVVAPAPTPTPAPTPAPARSPAPTPAPTFPGPLPSFGDAWINSISPNPARSGQQVQLGVSQGHAPVAGGVEVLFNGVQATVGSASFGPTVGTINVTVPNVPAGLYQVQFTAGNYVSHTFTFTVN